MTQLTIPDNSMMNDWQFIFGVATSAFQIEGQSSTRQSTIWDTFCHKSGAIVDGSNGDVACDHLTHWRDDVSLIDSLGVGAYRFSVSWGRVLNHDGSVNTKGMQFYLDLLTELEKRDIKAFVTLYHWDLPQALENNGGWLNRETVYAFEHYVDVVTKAFKGKVYSYATLNEPWCSAYLGYEIGIHAPGISGKQYGKKAAHHLLLAHGLAMQVLQKNSPESQNGIVLNFSPCFAASTNQADIDAAKLADQHFNHWYIKPLLEGKYPDIIDSLSSDHQPDIKVGDMDTIAANLDFLGVNYYSRSVYRSCEQEGFELVAPATFSVTQMGWEIYPQGLSKLLIDLNKHYTLPPVYITENGAAMNDEPMQGQIIDLDRVAYFNTHLAAVDTAMKQGVDVRGYFAWSLMDNFEWAEGYEKRFGIVYVDYQTQQRTLKESAKQYRNMLLNR
ncbi:beta-glucosidase [Pseudoalteromonas sp. MSK9-3]|uniref:GH1 family beta-glucosidase n=1 Tax=Pseudoalteromonas sp. MSK9-3 TaxID=1897633 RepID=UPI000E6BDF2F|nr:GH1 family beta-glucosidase [Pseudoalteromonas sp. MSK9-3]RJE77136.1 beta-glucosidase [Pseudoalteromonas sp. MSK9-3]